eukprot:EG_transcript_8724
MEPARAVPQCFVLVLFLLVLLPSSCSPAEEAEAEVGWDNTSWYVSGNRSTIPGNLSQWLHAGILAPEGKYLLYCPFGYYSPHSLGWGNQFTQLVNMVELAAQTGRTLVLWETQFCWVRWPLLFDMAALARHLQARGASLKVVDIQEVTEGALAVAGLDRHLKGHVMKSAVRRNGTRDRCVSTYHLHCQRFEMDAMNNKCQGSRHNVCIDCIIHLEPPPDGRNSIVFIRQGTLVNRMKQEPDPFLFVSGFSAFTFGSAPKVVDINWAKGLHIPAFSAFITQQAEEVLEAIFPDAEQSEGRLCGFQFRAGFGWTWRMNDTVSEMNDFARRHNCSAGFLATDIGGHMTRNLTAQLAFPLAAGGYTNATHGEHSIVRDAVAMAVENEILTQAHAFRGTLGSSLQKMVYLRRVAQKAGRNEGFCFPSSPHGALCKPGTDHAAFIRQFLEF